MSAPLLPPGFTTEAAKPVTKPGYLFELGFAPPLYFSTRGTQTYGGKTFAGGTVIAYDIGAKRLQLANPANGVSSIVLAQGVADRTARVWQFYGDAANDDSTILLFDGVIDGAPEIGERVTLTLFETSSGALFSPRLRITAENGFRVLPQPGLRVQWGNALIILKPGRD